MKIAIQISGDFRMLHASYPKFMLNLMNPLKEQGHTIDIFIHSWFRTESGPGTFYFPERGNWHNTMVVYTHNDGIQAYSPKRYLIEIYDEKKELHTKPRLHSMFYGIWAANEIRKQYEQSQNSTYDLVMRYRTDCILDEPMAHMFSPNTFILPRSSSVTTYDGAEETSNSQQYCDWLAWGPREMMDIYCDTYLNLEHLTKTESVPEKILYTALSTVSVLRPFSAFYLVEGNGQIRGNKRD
jgi:hypothetical protein